MDEPRFCSHCGGPLTTRRVEEKERLVCASCGAVNYLNPIPAAAVIIRDGEGVLLVKRAVEPRLGLWSLPAGFLETDETIQQCAVRETKEETNLDIELAGISGVYSVFDDPRYICLLVVYSGRVIGGTIRPGDDAAEARYFLQSALPPIAFSTHAVAIRDAFPIARAP